VGGTAAVGDRCFTPRVRRYRRVGSYGRRPRDAAALPRRNPPPSPHMSGRVYRLHSTLELPLEDLQDYFASDPELPGGVEDVDITRRNNTLILKAVSNDESIGKYTPTAQLKASVSETRVYEEEPPRTGGGWMQEEEEEIPSELVEFACFKGDRETVLQSSSPIEAIEAFYLHHSR